MSDAKSLTDERKKTHGDWRSQSLRSASLKFSMRDADGWSRLTDGQREALDMIAVKISRILTGDPKHDDHWDDIAGYAYLGKAGHV